MSPTEMQLLAYAVSITTGTFLYVQRVISYTGINPYQKSLLHSAFSFYIENLNIFLSRKMTPRPLTLGEGLSPVLSKEQGTPAAAAALWLPGCFPRLFFCDLALHILGNHWQAEALTEFNTGTPNWQSLYGYQHKTRDHPQPCCGRDPTPTWTLSHQHLPLIPQEQPHAYSLPGIQGQKGCKEGCEMTEVQTGKKGPGNYCYSNTYVLPLSWQWLQGYQTPAFEYLCSIWCPKQKLVTAVNLVWSLKMKSSWSVAST